MHVFVQVWAGVFYLLNKIFFLATETTDDQKKKNKRKKVSWWCYIMGLGAWLVILAREDNWIAFGAEVAGLPSMINGLVNAYRGKKNTSPLLTIFAVVTAFAGMYYSYDQLGGLTSQTQIMEFGIVVGFLIGTFLVGEEWRRLGYCCLLLMTASCAPLMFAQDLFWLGIQQVASFFIVLFALVLTFTGPRKFLFSSLSQIKIKSRLLNR